MGKKKLPNLQQYGNYQFADEFEKMMQKAGITKGNLVNSKEITSESDDSKDNLTLYKQNTGVPQNFRELAAILNSPKVVVSLDCEFYQDDAGEMWLRQLAIKQFGTSNILAYQFFDDAMPAERQLDFLKKYDMTFSQARKLRYVKLRKHIVAALKQINPDFVVGWGSDNDLKVLDREEMRAHIKQKKRLSINVPKIDLAQIIQQEVFGGKATLSLAKMGKLLGIDGFVPRHVAKNDVLLLDAVLQFYAHDFNAEII